MQVRSRAHLYVSAATHPGMRGKNNEDRYGVSCHAAGANGETPSLLALLCDGIGGHAAGEVAAEIAIETISRMVAESDASQPLETMRQAIQAASAAIRTQALAHSRQSGMGSTCVCAWILADKLHLAWVGDSRLYLLRQGQIRQLTIDHSWVQEAIELGALTPEIARKHPNAHVIQRYLGSVNLPEPDFRLRLQPDESAEQMQANQGLALEAGDLLLLCSDGLSDLVEPEEIQAILLESGRQASVPALIQLANERGGHDNITIIALEYPHQPISVAPESNVSANKLSLFLQRWWLPCSLGLGLAACLVSGLGLLAWRLLNSSFAP